MPRVPKLDGLEGNVPRLAALRFLCWMHLMSAVIMPFFREWGRLSFVQIFALQTWFMLMSFLMEVPTGARPRSSTGRFPTSPATSTCSRAGSTTSDRRRSCAPSRSTRSRAPRSPGP